jgi:hypothetical protein
LVVTRPLDRADGGAHAHDEVAVAQIVGEFLDQLAVDEIEKAAARLDQRDRNVERVEDGGIFDADHAGADHREAARQRRQVDDLVTVEHGLAVKRHIVRPVWPRAAGDQNIGAAIGLGFAVVGGHLDLVRPYKAALAAGMLDRIAVELMLQHLDLVVERLAQPHHKLTGGDVLLDAIGAAVEAALAPARQIEHRLAQGLRRNGPGMHRHAADAAALLDHQHRFAELGRLHRGPPPGRPAADDDHVVVVLHASEGMQVRCQMVGYSGRRMGGAKRYPSSDRESA